jgi:glutaredoxin
MRKVVFYTRRGCCLCDEALAVVEDARREVEFALEIIDIDDDDELVARYNDKVPVLTVDGRLHAKYRVDRAALLRRLRAPATEPWEQA